MTFNWNKAMLAHVRETPEDKIIRHAALLSSQLQSIREEMYPPEARKSLRRFMTHEVSKLTSIPEATLRALSNEGKGPVPDQLDNNYRVYTLEQVNELRHFFAQQKAADALRYLPHRCDGEHLQIIAIVNFKGGSAKTTSAAHLSHFLALKGYRVLAIDLDPQASLSALFGTQPELDIGDNETIYATLRHGLLRRPMKEIVRKTYFPGIDLVPGNIEVMEYEHETPHVLATKKVGADGLFFERLRMAIGEVEDDYDLVVLDTPPSLGFLTLGAIYAATGLIVTVHPAMLDIMSMCQFLLMMEGLIGAIRNEGGTLQQDFLHYLITRHDPHDQAQAQVVSLLRHLFGDDVLTPTAVESTAIESAGLAKRTLYELEAGNVGRDTFRRAKNSMDAVNERILDLITRSWRRS